MMRSIVILSQIVLIYIIVKLVNCSAYTEQSQSTFNQFILPTNILNAIDDDISAVNKKTENVILSQNSSNYYAEKAVEIAIESSQSQQMTQSDRNENFYFEQFNKNRHPKSERLKRDSEALDVCDTNECKCKFETKFLTVDCHFQQVSKLFFCYFIYNIVLQSYNIRICLKKSQTQ